ncbi:hypothetical protein LPB3_12055 [Polaribacter vadi]|uniref:Uncharacterized protein n=1 Tax=Polaribacter vadi TaxID=1774273 RepID=A0A1B8TSV6_9FLAO|nr:hypothetical protein LPB3_12055 [Polaribacter vadi]
MKQNETKDQDLFFSYASYQPKYILFMVVLNSTFSFFSNTFSIDEKVFKKSSLGFSTVKFIFDF